MIEKRYTPHKVTLRKSDGGGIKIIGYGAVYYRDNDPATEYRLFEDIVERIMPGAFERATTEGDDVRGLFNHDPNILLGRVGAGTMELVADDVGLRYEISPPDTQAARDVVAMIERGDLDGSSFSFVPGRVTWAEAGSQVVRQIEDFKTVHDTGPVTFPAYEGTTAAVRSLDGVRAEYEAHLANQRVAEMILTRRRAAGRVRVLGL